MKNVKKIFLCIPLVFLLIIALSITSFAYEGYSEEPNQKTDNNIVQHEIKYQIVTKEGEVREEGVLPIDVDGISPRLSFGPRTLYNGDTMLLVPAASPTSGFWIIGGTYIQLRFTLNRSASVSVSISKNSGSVIKSYSGATGGGSLGTSAPSTGYYIGRIRNASSDAVTVTSASFNF